MPPEIDVYQPCPCGSGKKIKFCCQPIIPDMQKIARMIESHQFVPAMQALDNLKKKPGLGNWSLASIDLQQARLLMMTYKLDEALAAAENACNLAPEFPGAVGTKAFLVLMKDGYPAARREVYRALLTDSHPAMRARIAMYLGRLLAGQRHYIAARAHFGLAMQLLPEDKELNELFSTFEASTSIAYPLRGSFSLKPLADEERFAAQLEAAEKFSVAGCWNEATRQFRSVAQQEPGDPAAWYNIGLCDAAAGDDALAAEAFRVSAKLQSDFEMAVDASTLAGLLSFDPEKHTTGQFMATYKLESASEVVTLLDAQGNLYREDPDLSNEDGSASAVEAIYSILERDMEAVPDDQLTPDNVANVVGFLSVMDALESGHQHPHLRIAWLDNPAGQQARQRVIETLGSLAEPEGEPAREPHRDQDFSVFDVQWRFPPTFPPLERARLWKIKHDQILQNVWPNTPQRVLNGKTPQEAVGVDDLKIALATAVSLLEIYCEQGDFPLDVDGLRSRLGLPPVAPLVVSSTEEAARLSILETRRVSVDQLEPTALMYLAVRSMPLNSALCYRLFSALVERPGFLNPEENASIHLNLSRIAYELDWTQDALDWIRRGREISQAEEMPLPYQFLWDMEETRIRSDDTSDPLLPAAAHNLWQKYYMKLPESRPQILQVLIATEVAGPWQQQHLVAVPDTPAASEGVWTPQAQTAGASSRLWLPGQD